jgi:hypothetical protein
LTSQSVEDRLDGIGSSGLVAAEVALPHLTTGKGNKNLTGKTANQILLPNKIPQTKIRIR